MSHLSISSSDVKDKRELFEAQLRSLQNDIGELSQKLSIPLSSLPNGTSHQNTTTTSTTDDILTSRSDDHIYYSRTNNDQQVKKTTKKNVSFDPKQKSNSSTSSSVLSQKKAEVVRLGRDLRNVTRERDDLQFRYDQLKRETDDIKKTLSDFGRLRSLCDNLQQDNDSLKMSLESSEKIRKQQKELIIMMQRSTQHSIDSASQASSIFHIPPSTQLNTSVSSFGGGSSITDSTVGSAPMVSNVSFAPSVTSVTDEQRNWLHSHSGDASSSSVIYRSAGPSTYLASPAASSTLPKHRVVADISDDHIPQPTRTRTKEVTSSRSSPTKRTTKGSSVMKATKGKTLSRREPSTTTVRKGVNNKGNVGSTKKTTSSLTTTTTTSKPKKPTKTKSNKEPKRVKKRVKSDNVDLNESFITHTTNNTGVLSYDRVIGTGGLVVPSPYGQLAYQQQQHQSGKPPRAPRRPSSASSLRGRSSHPQHPPVHDTVRSRSLTPEVSSYHSQFNLTRHSQYHNNDENKRRSTYINSRRSQK